LRNSGSQAATVKRNINRWNPSLSGRRKNPAGGRIRQVYASDFAEKSAECAAKKSMDRPNFRGFFLLIIFCNTSANLPKTVLTRELSRKFSATALPDAGAGLILNFRSGTV
jgi:hypothetical protein